MKWIKKGDTYRYSSPYFQAVIHPDKYDDGQPDGEFEALLWINYSFIESFYACTAGEAMEMVHSFLYEMNEEIYRDLIAKDEIVEEDK